eukprot:gene34060-41226_t
MTSTLAGPRGEALHIAFDKTKGCESNFILHRGKAPIGNHFALEARNGTENITHLQHVVTFVREPVSRTISHAFYYGPISTMYTSMEELTRMGGGHDAIIARYEKLLWEFGTYGDKAKNPSVFQTSVVMGTPNATAQEACKRISHLGFVGLTSLWNSSICSFYHTFGRLQALPFELANARPTITAGNSYWDDYPLLRAVFRKESGEWPDMKLYECAVRRFVSSVRNTPCAHLAHRDLQSLDEEDSARLVIEKIFRETFFAR